MDPTNPQIDINPLAPMAFAGGAPGASVGVLSPYSIGVPWYPVSAFAMTSALPKFFKIGMLDDDGTKQISTRVVLQWI